MFLLAAPSLYVAKLQKLFFRMGPFGVAAIIKVKVMSPTNYDKVVIKRWLVKSVHLSVVVIIVFLAGLGSGKKAVN